MSQKERAARQEFEKFRSRGGRYHMHWPTMWAANSAAGVAAVMQRYQEMREEANLAGPEK